MKKKYLSLHKERYWYFFFIFWSIFVASLCKQALSGNRWYKFCKFKPVYKDCYWNVLSYHDLYFHPLIFFLYLYMLVFHIYFWKYLQFKIKIHSVSILVLYILHSLNVPVGCVYYDFYFSREREREEEIQRKRKKGTLKKTQTIK